MTELQKAIIISSMIGSILDEYSPYDEGYKNNKNLELLRKRLRKMQYNRVKSNRTEYIEATNIGNKVWRKAINHFADKKIAIETTSIVARLYYLYDKQLERYTGIKDKHIDSFTNGAKVKPEIEANSYIVADYILNELKPYTGISQNNRLSTKRKIIETNLILEGKV